MNDFPNIEGRVVCPDSETNGLDWTNPKISAFGVALSVQGGGNYYWDFRKQPSAARWLADNINKASRVVNHNIKFDMHMLRKWDINIDPTIVECTQIRAALINEHLHSYSLDSLLKKYLDISKWNQIYEELAALFGGKPTRDAQMPNLHRAPVGLVAKYAKDDSRGALKLWEWQEEEIARQGLGKVWDLERRLFKVVYKSEVRGIRIDEEAADRATIGITAKVEQDIQELRELAGFEVNPNPSGSIKKLFKPKWDDRKKQWFAVDGTPLESTDAGNPSLGADALRLMKHPAAPIILRCRKLMKTRDTFIQGHILGHARNGYVHPNINQTKGDSDGAVMGTGTGRLSYTAPALQQIPARDKTVAAMVRPLFLPDPGQGWSYGDLDQHEYRIFAHYVNNPAIIQAYADNPDLDFHQRIADLTGLPRSAPMAGGPNAKQLNLGMVFTMGAGHMAALCNLPWEWDEFETRDGEVIRFQRAGPEGEALVEEYHRNVPGIREMAKKAKRVAMSRGHIRTLRGRHIRFPHKSLARKASGLLYQGGAADLNKENMILIDEYFESECPQGRLLLSIHDEYSMSMPRDGKEVQHLKEIQRLIQDKPDIRVPIRIDFSMSSKNWWEATEAEYATR